MKTKPCVKDFVLAILVLKRGMANLNHYTHAPQSGVKPKQIIVLLHGYGSNGRDLISLAPYWQPSVPEAIFVSPDAPFFCDAVPEMSDTMHQWFSLTNRTPERDLAGVKKAALILDSYLDSLLSHYGLSDDKLALVGFSQGTMMSLYVGPNRTHKIAGILGYSGSLIGAETLDLVKENEKPPIHLIHGEADSVVPIERYYDSVKRLKAKGFQVSGHTTPMLEHSIDNDGIESGAKFLSKIFS